MSQENNEVYEVVAEVTVTITAENKEHAEVLAYKELSNVCSDVRIDRVK